MRKTRNSELSEDLKTIKKYIVLRDSKKLEKIKRIIAKASNKALKKNPENMEEFFKTLQEVFDIYYSPYNNPDFKLSIMHITTAKDSIVVYSDYRVDWRSQKILEDVGRGLRNYLEYSGHSFQALAFAYEDISGNLTYRMVELELSPELYNKDLFRGHSNGTIRQFKFSKIRNTTAFTSLDFEKVIIYSE